jgi:hypothetical protein
VLRLVFVIATALAVYALVDEWSTNMFGSLISWMFSYTHMTNWCYVASTGQPSNCRDYHGNINEQCRARQMYMSGAAGTGGTPPTCQDISDAGGIVFHYGAVLNAVMRLVWLFIAFRILLHLWCHKERRSRCRSRSPSRSRSRSRSPRTPRLHISENAATNKKKKNSLTTTANGKGGKGVGKKQKLTGPSIPPAVWQPDPTMGQGHQGHQGHQNVVQLGSTPTAQEDESREETKSTSTSGNE